MVYPTLDEMKIMVDQLVKASVNYVVVPTEENLSEALLARQTVHAGLALLDAAAKKAPQQ